MRMSRHNQPLIVPSQGDSGELGDDGIRGRAGEKVRNVFNHNERTGTGCSHVLGYLKAR